jgi:hypothetical protein
VRSTRGRLSAAQNKCPISGRLKQSLSIIILYSSLSVRLHSKFMTSSFVICLMCNYCYNYFYKAFVCVQRPFPSFLLHTTSVPLYYCDDVAASHAAISHIQPPPLYLASLSISISITTNCCSRLNYFRHKIIPQDKHESVGVNPRR